MIFFAILAAAKAQNTHPSSALVPAAASVPAAPSRPAAASVPAGASAALDS